MLDKWRQSLGDQLIWWHSEHLRPLVGAKAVYTPTSIQFGITIEILHPVIKIYFNYDLTTVVEFP